MSEYLFANPLKQIWLKCHYFIATLREFYRYPYVLIGEAYGSNSKTILKYRMRGKRDIYEDTAQNICNDAKLISQFHPLDARIIAYICGIEQVLEIPEEKRLERFSLIKNRVFKK